MAAAAAAAVAVLGVTGVVAGARRLWRRVRRAHTRQKYDGLDGVVSFSSRLIAAARALESLRPDALVVDPLAHILAGPKAMAKHQVSDESDSKPPEPATDGTPTPPREVPRLIMRTCFFDDAVMAVTSQPVARSEQCLGPVLQYLQQHSSPRCLQVVMLGAGMDTRPWRLPLSPGVQWFELDRQDVLAAKQTTLKSAGASFSTDSSNGSSNGNSSGQGGNSDQGGSSSQGSSSSQHALRARAWGCATADLQQPGWSSKLLEAGLDPSKPIAWVAEGLLYYLESDSVGPMLQEAARLSPPGSMIISNFMTDEGMKNLHAGAAAARQRSATKASGSSTSNANPSSSNSQQREVTPDSTKAFNNTSSSGQAAPNSAEAGATPTMPPPSDLQKSGLLSHFKWGCPDDCEQFFGDCGWQLLVRYSWTQAADKYGWTPKHTPASRARSNSQEVQFVVGAVAK